MQLYIIQDRVSRQFGEPFSGFNDDQVRRDMHRAFAHGIVAQQPMHDAVCFAIGNILTDENHYIIDNYPAPRPVCTGDDAEVQSIVRDLLTRMEAFTNEKNDS